MLHFIQAVMNKPEWRRKLKDPSITARWKKEAEECEVREPVFEYAMKELEWHAEDGDPATGIEPTGVDMVWVCAR
jgi:hypothetical protein